MAASEFIAAAIAAFSVGPLPTATTLSAASDMRCMPMKASVRAVAAGSPMRDWRDGWSAQPDSARLRLARGCADGAPASSLGTLVAALQSWLDGSDGNLTGAA